MNKDNIILIGMPASGKSTAGVVLAKFLGYDFIDTDILIQEKTGKLLHEIISEKGLEGFKELEEDINASVCCHKSIISPGGSVIYGERAMRHFKEIGTVVYLKLHYMPLHMLHLTMEFLHQYFWLLLILFHCHQ